MSEAARETPLDISTALAAAAAEHGLKPGEIERAVAALGRAPNRTELGIISVMWSEHCSYKSSRVWLKTLPTTGACVIMGPGENAGVVAIGDGPDGKRLAAIFKMESHNHPSFIEPYQGAATGVGGIMRDVFTMGARPVALLNALRFGAADHPRTRHLVRGVVAGIGDYGNCTGVPTVGGEVNFDARYNDNILVNAMCVGVADAARIFTSAAEGSGNPVVYVGAKTGRDGIHGATMASAEFDDASDAKRPTVQVGDPFMEKLLIEACLELMAGDAILAIQDMGAAGLTSSSVEMAAKGGGGMLLELDAVPQREAGMTAYEMMLSESQERMLMVLRPGAEPAAEAIFRKWGLDFAIIGTTNETGRMVVRHAGQVQADLPTDMLADGAPQYHRPHVERIPPATVAADAVPQRPLGEALAALMASPALASRRWVWQQYDQMVGADTAQRPGGDAGVVRVHGTSKALALSCDVTPRYCAADAKMGAMQAVAECWRNLTAVGATPLAITNCLNFGNPERPEIMGEFVAAIAGIAEACRALDFPVVSGNVSLYNETNGVGIPPTPAIGGIGLVADCERQARAKLLPGDTVLRLGGAGGHLGQSLYQQWAAGSFTGAPPSVDLVAERSTGDFVRRLIAGGIVARVHDISDGGLLVALVEMALAGNCGVIVDRMPCAEAFGEDQARYLVASPDPRAVIEAAHEAGIAVHIVARGEGHDIVFDGEPALPLASVRAAHEATLPALFGAPTE